MKKAHMSGFILLFVILRITASATKSDAHYGEITKSMASNLRSTLVILGHTASQAHPKLGLDLPIDPLPAVAPLRYTNEGDLLKLRLLLTNATLNGISSLTVQEISFVAVGNTNGRSHQGDASTGIHAHEDQLATDLPFTQEEIETSKRITDNDDTFDTYEYNSGKTHTDANPNNNFHGSIYDHYYYYDEDSKTFLDEETDHKDQFSEDKEDDEYADYDEERSVKKEGGDKQSSTSEVAKTRYERSVSSKNIRDEQSKRRHSRTHNQKRHSQHGRHLVFQIEQQKDTIKRHVKPNRHHHQPIRERHHRSGKQTRSVPGGSADDYDVQPVLLDSKVRIAFNNLKIDAQYVIRGSAGGVFTFKEQGRLELIIPNVFLTSHFNVTITPDHAGMRHWNNRRNHMRVQKVQTRMTLETPRLKLHPTSRSPEWIRRQVQEKMEELGAGVGRRDGAIRLLLRHWAKLLRRLVIKAAKNPAKN